MEKSWIDWSIDWMNDVYLSSIRSRFIIIEPSLLFVGYIIILNTIWLVKICCSKVVKLLGLIDQKLIDNTSQTISPDEKGFHRLSWLGKERMLLRQVSNQQIKWEKWFDRIQMWKSLKNIVVSMVILQLSLSRFMTLLLWIIVLAA